MVNGLACTYKRKCIVAGAKKMFTKYTFHDLYLPLVQRSVTVLQTKKLQNPRKIYWLCGLLMVNFSVYVQIRIRHNLAKSNPLNPLSHHLRDGACACTVTQMYQYTYFKVSNQPRQPANQELRDGHHKKKP